MENGEHPTSTATLGSLLTRREEPVTGGPEVEGDGQARARPTSTFKQRGMKKYQIVVPETLFEEIEKIADSRQTTVIDIIRRFLKLGILTAKIEGTPNSGLFIREDGSEREIILL